MTTLCTVMQCVNLYTAATDTAAQIQTRKSWRSKDLSVAKLRQRQGPLARLLDAGPDNAVHHT